MAKFLVTGGAGFIGSHIVERLVRDGAEVVVLDDLSSGNEENLTEVLNKITFIKGDVRDLDLLRKITEDVDYILHEAAMASVPASIDDPLKCHEVNVTGTINVLLSAKENGVKRVVYAASSAVYGNNETLPKKEDMYPEPLSPYAVSKYAGELYLQVFARIYGIEAVGLRYFNVYGPKQDPKSQYAAVIPKFIDALLKGMPPTIYGDGLQTRDFIFIDDVVEANMLALTARGASGKVFNIACGERISLNRLYKVIKEIIGVDIEPVYAEARVGDVRDSLADISLARNILGFEPKVSLEEGLKKTVEWHRRKLEVGK
ncbi:Vi polysaccharide biosynthesis protein VipB/TviC [Carboxydothermus islandicus]|uniref:Vi polysaccharide biosynthesis protein VipB/TviC n=1 Tax=Carboxydothermus islandicus TaxID=661089 RepID=A0A1L8D4X3_9THEO|nr:SDR family oxidoreductase [Carboxydothermus islandicus]GAV26220.1 Vi polysaccharide biosynthesis protein VipB/TviC [Carboxydothermus islandicus]